MMFSLSLSRSGLSEEGNQLARGRGVEASLPRSGGSRMLRRRGGRGSVVKVAFALAALALAAGTAYAEDVEGCNGAWGAPAHDVP